MSVSKVTVTKELAIVCLFLLVSMVREGLCKAKGPCRCYLELEAALISGQHGDENMESLREAFFPESSAPPLQVIVTYDINNSSQTWSWSLNLMYTFCGARYLAEMGMGIPVISVLKMVERSPLATPFVKVSKLDLQLDNAPDNLNRNEQCLTKMTSLLHEYAVHGGNTSLVRVGSAVYGYHYDTHRELVGVQEHQNDTFYKILVTYCVLLSFFLLLLLYYFIREYRTEAKQIVCGREKMGYSLFWGVIAFMFISNTWHTALYISLWRLGSSHIYYVFDENTNVFLGLWWSILALCQLLAAALLPKDTSFPLPCTLYLPIRALCFGMKKERVCFICQTFVVWCILYFAHIQGGALMFTAAAIVADPVTSSTWLTATLFLKIAAVAVLSSFFALERTCNQHKSVHAPLQTCIREALHLLSWSTPFLGVFFLIGGLSGLTFMDKETQPPYVSSIASFLLAPTILTFLGLLSKIFINRLFTMATPDNGTFPDNNTGYAPIGNDDFDM